MKRVYFVRHGQSTKNTQPVRLGPEAPLTQLGYAQSHALAQRCAHLGIQKIITSPFVRTVQTAQAIVQVTGAPLSESDLFAEHKRPSQQIGIRRDDPMAQQISRMIRDHFHELHYHYSDEENFSDLKIRARRALEHLVGQSEEVVLVVTHGYFLRMLIAYALHGERLTSYEFIAIKNFLEPDNTGLTYLEHTDNGEFPWKLHIWNDDAHLGS